MRMSWLLIVIITIFISAHIGYAKIYSWTENGVKYYSDTPPPEGIKNYQETEAIPQQDFADAKPDSEQQQPPAAAPEQTDDASDTSGAETDKPVVVEKAVAMQQQYQWDLKWLPKVQTEEKRLIKEIEYQTSVFIRPRRGGRGKRGPTTVKNRQVEQLMQQLESLYQDPEKYFATREPQ